MKVNIDPFEANFAKPIFLTINIVDVEGKAIPKIVTKETIVKSSIKSGNVA